MNKIFILLICIFIVGGSVFANINFYDVSDSYWGAEVIYKLANKGVINGYTDGSYKPLNSVTYGEFIKLVMMTALPENFETSSVTCDFEHWAAAYVKLAEVYGIIKDEMINENNINIAISRIDMASIIAMADMVFNNSSFDNSKELIFNDIYGVIGKERTLLTHAYSKGLILGNPNGSFRPEANMNRAEAATVIDRLMSLGG